MIRIPNRAMRSIGREIKSITAHAMSYSYSSSYDHCRSEKSLLRSVETPLHVHAFEDIIDNVIMMSMYNYAGSSSSEGASYMYEDIY